MSRRNLSRFLSIIFVNFSWEVFLELDLWLTNICIHRWSWQGLPIWLHWYQWKCNFQLKKKIDILFNALIFQGFRDTTQFYSTSRTICLKGKVTCWGFLLCGRSFIRCWSSRTRLGCIVTIVGYYIVIGNANCKREKSFMKIK